MPSGGYGVDQEDLRFIREGLNDKVVKESGMEVEFCATYATARANGATPKQAAVAAYNEWDL